MSSYRTKRVSSVEAFEDVSAKKKTYISVYDSQDDIHDSMRDGVAVPHCAKDGTTETPGSPAQHSPDASTVTIKSKRVLPQLIKFKKCRSIGTGTDLIDPTWTDKGPGSESCFNFVPCVEKQARLFDKGTTATVHSGSENEYFRDDTNPSRQANSHSAGESVFIVQTKKRPTVPLEDWPCHVCGVPAPRSRLRIRIPFLPDPDPAF